MILGFAIVCGYFTAGLLLHLAEQTSGPSRKYLFGAMAVSAMLWTAVLVGVAL
jgi:hypothetical protein